MTPPRRDWAALAPLQRTVGAPPLTSVGDTFTDHLASRSARPLVQPLTHGVMRDAPTGQLRGIAHPSEGVVPEPAAAAPQPDLPLAGEEAPVQRAALPARRQLTSAPRIDAPGRRVHPVPPVQRQAAEPATPGAPAPAAAPGEMIRADAVATAPPAVELHEAAGDGADLPVVAGGGAETVSTQRSASESGAGPSTPPATPLVEATATPAVEGDAPTLATGQPLHHEPTAADGTAGAGAGTPSGVAPAGVPTPGVDPLPVARTVGGEAPPPAAGRSPAARSVGGDAPSAPSVPGGAPRPSTAPAAIQRTGATGRRPPRRVGLGEPLMPPVQRSVVGRVEPPVAQGDGGSSAAEPSGGGVPVDAPLIGGRPSATSLDGPEPAAPAAEAEAEDSGAAADLPLQRSEAGSAPTPGSPGASGGATTSGTSQAAVSGRAGDAPPAAPDPSAGPRDAPAPEPVAASSSESAAAEPAIPSQSAPAGVPLIGDRPPATALSGAELNPPPVGAAGATAGTVLPNDSAGDLPLQRRSTGDTGVETPAGSSSGGRVVSGTSRSSTGGPTTSGALPPSEAPSTVARSTIETTAASSVADGATPPDTAGAPAPDAGPVALPDAPSPMAFAPLLPHRPGLIQRTLDLHADSGAAPAGEAGHTAQPATRRAPTGPAVPGPRGTASPGAPSSGPGASRAARPAQVVQPLRRVGTGTPVSASPGSSPASVGPGDGVGPLPVPTATPDAVPGPGGTGSVPPLPGPTDAVDVVPLQPAAAPGATGIGQAVQTLAAGAPAMPGPATAFGRQAPEPGPVAAQRVAATGPAHGASAALAAASGFGTGVAGGDVEMAVPPAFTALPAAGLSLAHATTGLPPADPTPATAGSPLAGPAVTTAVQRELATSVPVPEPAATPSAEVQRQESPAPPAAAPAPPTATIAAEAADVPDGRGGRQTEEELDVLAGRLYDHIAGRLRHELRMDRERTGLLNDLH